MLPYEQNFYRTSDGSLDIEFLFVDLGAVKGWRAYILSQIDYKGRSTSCATIHYHTELDSAMVSKINQFIYATRTQDRISNHPIHYICWTQKITSLESMKTIAKAWSEITAYYIKHGGDFAAIQSTLSQRGII